MRRFALVLSFVGLAALACADISVTPEQSKCLGEPTDGKDTFEVEVKGCVVFIHHLNVVTNCCLDYAPKVSYDGGSMLTVTEVDNGPPCDCFCPFDLTIAIQGLEMGIYAITMETLLYPPEVVALTVDVPLCRDFILMGAEVWSSLGTTGVVMPISMSNPKLVQGFSFGTTYPLRYARMAEINLKGTVTEEVGAELFVAVIDNTSDGSHGWATCSVILDVEEPFDRQTIPPGEGQLIANLVYDLMPPSDPIPRSMSVPLVDGVGDPPVKLVFVVDGKDVAPFVQNGIIQLNYQPQFIRADVNDSGDISIADPVYLLSYLFADGAEPPCMDAADANDDKDVNLADAVSVLRYLFAGGTIPPPSPPGPAGPDPTDDELGCARNR
jgi:hypothetical protein